MPHDREPERSESVYGVLCDPAFFERSPILVARSLLGCLLVTRTPSGETGGRIVETEAYLGSEDPGSHAATRSVTPRNSVMYAAPGTVYVYVAYGCHHMLNLVCHEEGRAGAVLIRALEPTVGLSLMRSRRGQARGDRELCNGPGKLCAALAVDLSDNAATLGNGRITVYDCSSTPLGEVAVTGRVGLSVGHELEYRYYLKQSAFVSRGRPGLPRRRRRADPEEGTG